MNLIAAVPAIEHKEVQDREARIAFFKLLFSLSHSVQLRFACLRITEESQSQFTFLFLIRF